MEPMPPSVMPRRERFRRAASPAAGVMIAAAVWLVGGLALVPYDGGGLLLWAGALAIFLGPLLLMVSFTLGLRMRPPRRGIVEGALIYSILLVLPVAVAFLAA